MIEQTQYLISSENIQSQTSEATYRQGLFYFKQDRVFECSQSQGEIFAQVEGKDSELPYNVYIDIKQAGNIKAGCECDDVTSPLCKHAVAALLAYIDDTQEAQEHNRFVNLKETAIKDRIKRGQSEVKIEHLDGHPVFGLFKATSLAENTPWARSYTVHIRSLQQKKNYCDCPDLLHNQLGTCKHIEAALHYINLQSSAKTSTDPQSLASPLPFILYDSQSDSKIQLQRTANMNASLNAVLDKYFDKQGNFVGKLPDDYFYLESELYGNQHLLFGEDAKRYCKELAQEQNHYLQKQIIRQQIFASNGKIKGVQATLYPYQIEGVAFLAANGRALLADDMGLGKTLQSIAAAQWLINSANVDKIVIICPTSLKQQWAREIEKFTGHRCQIIQGGADKRQAQYQQSATFYILNYELLLRDLNVLNENLAPDLLILDEAQRIKNWRTKVATATKLINSRYAFVLSGTPLENKLEELYSLMQVVDPKIIGPLWRYYSDYHVLDDKGKVQGYRNLSELRKVVNPHMLRRDRSIVSDQLPDRTVLRIDTPMTSKQRELHDSGLSTASYLADIANKRPLTPSEHNRMMAALQQARMACNAAGLVDKETQGAPKLNELKRLITEQCIELGEKMVVFSQWKGMTTMVESMLQQMKVGFVHLHGGVPSNKRGDLMQKFSQESQIKVFISTDAGGSGLNLQSATMLVNLDVPWNPAVLEQRNARIHRLGQRKKVSIILMVAENAYEQRVLQLTQKKQDLFDNVVNPEAEQDVVGISKQSLKEVLKDLDKHKDQTQETESISSDEMGVDGQIIQTQDIDDDLEQSPTTVVEMTDDESTENSITSLIGQVQVELQSNLKQVLTQQGGLLFVVDQVNDEIEAYFAKLDTDIQHAVIDSRTQRQLARLGNANPIAASEVIPLTALEPESSQNIWLNQSKKKLAAAEHLLQAEQDGVMDLLVASITALITWLADKPELMSDTDIPIWLYSEATQKQLLTPQQAANFSQIMSFKMATDLPIVMQQQLLDDYKSLIKIVESAKL
ncbi:DEAD/DEAH box helicase [Saccharobesus litoralis]|nr:DEAD/DEAH box helicase [Saccharobesus litoralis]